MPLHTHTDYSILDGAVTVSGLVEKSKRLGFEALAKTDHGVLYGSVEHYVECKRAGIKPILGCELYVVEDAALKEKQQMSHLVVLAMNETGWKNLLWLVSWSNLEGFHYRPRVDKKLLAERGEGLVGMSACLAGEIPQALLSGLEGQAVNIAEEYTEIFSGNFFLEAQYHGLEEEEKVLAGLRGVSKEAGVRIVATNDTHYLEKEDVEVQEMLLCLQTGAKLEDEDRFRFRGEGYHLRSEKEMAEAMPGWEDAIQMTQTVADLCNLELEIGKPKLPGYRVEEGKSQNGVLKELIEDGLKEKGVKDTEKIKRTWREYEVVTEMNLEGYFLIVNDLVGYAKDNGVRVGPGRGSAAGSMICYLLGVTEIDPVENGLFFERFLNRGRAGSLPDIDMDFADAKRDVVFNHVKEKYGEDHVAHVVTYGRIGCRRGVRDVAKIMGVSFQEGGRIADMIKGPPGITMEEALEQNGELGEEYKNNPVSREIIDRARKIEGLIRNSGVHAAGVVISDRPIYETAALERSKGKTDQNVIQADLSEVEELGLLKMDLLGLRNLTVIDECLKIVLENQGLVPDIESLDDEGTFRTIREGNTVGVFQLESDGMRGLLRDVCVENFNDLVACVALFRPGPLSSGMGDMFAMRKRGEQPLHYIHPEAEEVLKETMGVIIYQEQVMGLAASLAGYNLEDADKLRKAMGKKRPEIMAKEQEKFVGGAVRKGMEREKAEKLFEAIKGYSGYAFNKSHSAAYAIIAYQTAYLKTHFTCEYMTALLESLRREDSDRKGMYVKHAKSLGIDVLPPEVNRSGAGFSTEEGGIRYGLASIKGVGAAASRIEDERKKSGEYDSLEEFLKRVELSAGEVESLAMSGALDGFGERGVLVENAGRLAEWGRERRRQAKSGQMNLFADEGPALETAGEENYESRVMEWEREVLGAFMNKHPVDMAIEEVKEHAEMPLSEIPRLKNGQWVTLAGVVMNRKYRKNGDKKAYLKGTMEDGKGEVSLIAFSDVAGFINRAARHEVLVISGRIEFEQEREDAVQLVANDVWTCRDVEKKTRIIVKVPAAVTADSAKEAVAEVAAEHPGRARVILSRNGEKSRHFEVRGTTIDPAAKEALSQELARYAEEMKEDRSERRYNIW